MKDIKVLGTGCAKCKSTVAIIEQVANAKSVAINLEKIEDMQQIVSYGCGFHGHPATHSMNIRPLIPR